MGVSFPRGSIFPRVSATRVISPLLAAVPQGTEAWLLAIANRQSQVAQVTGACGFGPWFCAGRGTHLSL